MADRFIVLGRAAAERTKAAVNRIERMPYPTASTSSKYPIISGSAGQYTDGIVTVAITACNGSTYGQGVVQPVYPSFNSNTNTWVVINSNTFGGVVNTLNFSLNSGTVAVNTHVGIIQRDSANSSLVFELIWRDC